MELIRIERWENFYTNMQNVMMEKCAASIQDEIKPDSSGNFPDYMCTATIIFKGGLMVDGIICTEDTLNKCADLCKNGYLNIYSIDNDNDRLESYIPNKNMFLTKVAKMLSLEKIDKVKINYMIHFVNYNIVSASLQCLIDQGITDYKIVQIAVDYDDNVKIIDGILTKENLNLDCYIYQIRHGDNPDTPCTIEDSVTINFYGNFYTPNIIALNKRKTTKDKYAEIAFFNIVR